MCTKIVPIKWSEYEGFYMIHSNGQVWSNRKQSFLTIAKCNTVYDYPKISLFSNVGKLKLYNLHTIIAEHFVPKPTDVYGNLEVNHIDMNKLNSDMSNLEWVTHQSNMLKARQEKKWVPGRSGFTMSEETKLKMAEKKQKKIILYNDDNSLIFNSIGEFCTEFNTYRKLFNRYVNTHRTYKGFYIRYLK